MNKGDPFSGAAQGAAGWDIRTRIFEMSNIVEDTGDFFKDAFSFLGEPLNLSLIHI